MPGCPPGAFLISLCACAISLPAYTPLPKRIAPQSILDYIGRQSFAPHHSLLPLLLLGLELLLCSPTVSTCHCRSRCSPDTTLASTFPSGTPASVLVLEPLLAVSVFPSGTPTQSWYSPHC